MSTFGQSFVGRNFLPSILVYVPDTVVGSVIGKQGSYVKMLQQITGTKVNVQKDYFTHRSNAACMAERIPETNSVTNVEEYGESIAKQAVEDALSSLSLNEKVQSTSHNNGKPTSNQDLNRLVKIEAKDQSTDNDVLKAVFWIYQRISEVKCQQFGITSLHLEFKIPDRVVGSLIGKQGSSLVRISRGADVQVNSKKDGVSDATVCLVGTFGQVLHVICRILLLRAMCYTQDFVHNRSHTNGHPNRQLRAGFSGSTSRTPMQS